MAENNFYQTILDTLEGRTDQLSKVPRERLDWSGPGALLELYRKTSGNDRTALIVAIGEIIYDHVAPAHVLAQLVHIASSLDLSELEEPIRELEGQAVSSEEPLQAAIANFFAFRQLNDASKSTTTPRIKKMRRKVAKARTGGRNGQRRRN
jgi:hypothetical protein